MPEMMSSTAWREPGRSQLCPACMKTSTKLGTRSIKGTERALMGWFFWGWQLKKSLEALSGASS